MDYTEYNSHVGNHIMHCSQSDKDNIAVSVAHTKLSHAREDATKTSASSINGNLKINDSEVSVYQHPFSGTAQGTYSSVTVDTNGHVTAGSNPTVPLTRGGTGATSASDALANLGLTATASELNKLDGASVSTAEINHLSGSTKNIQAQLNEKADLKHGSHIPDISAATNFQFLSNNGEEANWQSLTKDDITTALGYTPGSSIPTAVKGAAESEYQTGNVNITPEKIGLGNVPNVSTNNQTPTFTEATVQENLKSGDTLKTLFSKIMKWFANLKSGAFATVVNNDTTSVEGYVADARVVKMHGDKILLHNNALTKLNNDLTAMSVTYKNELITCKAGVWREYTFPNLIAHKISFATIADATSSAVGCYVMRDYNTTG